MAAAEYFQLGARPPFEQQNSLHFPPPPQRASSSQPAFGGWNSTQQGHPSPQHPPQTSQYPPPPYQPLNHEQQKPQPAVHFAQTPSPGGGHHRPSVGAQPRPQQSYAINQNQPIYHAHPSQQLLAPYQHQQNPYVPPEYQNQQSQPYYPPPPQQYPRPSISNTDLAYGGVGGGYLSDPEPHRRKHKNRSRRISDNSRSTKADAFLGAAGGGLIGDLIFPGLGTLGGAVVGWVGGKDYGKHRKWREDKRVQRSVEVKESQSQSQSGQAPEES
ncbi:hypothetical protein LTR40_009485 [Exophiala xenobiotica]|nr:hypothetical protein LTR40_009485 [Exophiala xenobiotica]